MSANALLEIVDTASQSGALTSTALDIGIIAACFGIFVSISDFVISLEQKKKLDIFIDGLTLRLNYTRTFDWLQRWLKATRRASIASAVFTTITVLLALIVLTTVEWALWAHSNWWKLIVVGTITMMVWSWQWSYVSKAYDTVGVPVIDWLASATSYCPAP